MDRHDLMTLAFGIAFALTPVLAIVGTKIASALRARGRPVHADLLAIAVGVLVKHGKGEDWLTAVREELDSPEAHELAELLHANTKQETPQ